jgi:hypothetical protein
VVEVTAFRVQAQRVERWWMLTSVDAPGAVSQVRSLAQAETTIREAIAFVQGIPEGAFTVTVEPLLAPEHQHELTRARDAMADAEHAMAAAAEQSRELVRVLSQDAGMTGSDIAAVLNVSKQRVSQLRAAKPAREIRVDARLPDAPAVR